MHIVSSYELSSPTAVEGEVPRVAGTATERLTDSNCCSVEMHSFFTAQYYTFFYQCGSTHAQINVATAACADLSICA